MPIYVYKCPKCKKTHEVIRNIKDTDRVEKCKKCKVKEYRVIGKTYLKFNTRMS